MLKHHSFSGLVSNTGTLNPDARYINLHSEVSSCDGDNCLIPYEQNIYIRDKTTNISLLLDGFFEKVLFLHRLPIAYFYNILQHVVVVLKLIVVF